MREESLMLKRTFVFAFLVFAAMAYAFDSGVKVEVDTTKYFTSDVKENAAYREVLQHCRMMAIAKGMPSGTSYSQYVRKFFFNPTADFNQQKAEQVFSATAGAGYIISEETKNKFPIYAKKIQGYRYKVEYLARIVSPQYLKDSSLSLKLSLSKGVLKPLEEAELSMIPERDGYLFAFLIGSDNKLKMLYPPAQGDSKLIKKGNPLKLTFVAEENAKVKEGIATLYVVFTSANIPGWYKLHPREADDSPIHLGDESFNILKNWLPIYDPATRADRFIQLLIVP